MSRFVAGRFLAPGLLRPLSKSVHSPAVTPPQWARLFSQSQSRNLADIPPQAPPQSRGPSLSMDRLVKNVLQTARSPTEPINQSLAETLEVNDDQGPEPYHFHIFSHKHNTHITLTKPNRESILSLSCGNLGFKKSQRKNYDAAYQLGAYVIDKMHQKNLVKKIHKLEVVLRGFGQGREAVVKVLMGNEGKLLRPKIVRLSDSTRVKFGGTRSKRMRRLG
ncbi:uncharacterized protein C8A04DRAFT_11157 [Dichotomopilus funicola]|uniref:Small ribosomal subunit protein uS11m n=1 Tax=Dichotomopilus funicola TaxID=1934379 RepID=A0AAN6ZN97_9PEZI|nr:hypothetical protein C8A04DRAFT_11157 [Dichotomopilus funicola]